MRLSLLAAAFAFVLASCAAGPLPPERGPGPPLPTSGPILYTCADGTQLQVTFQQRQALVAVVGGVSMALPVMGADYYSNGRYSIRGRGAATAWSVGRAAPIACEGH
ncbi:MAG: hypothetical protein AB7L65_06255 [Hyphomonadaceae bacterium]